MTKTRTRFGVALVAMTVLLGAAVGAATAATAGSLSSDPATPGADARHAATVTAGSATAGSVNGFAVNYESSGADASNVAMADVVKVGIDRGDDASGTTIDENVTGDLQSVSTSNEGHLLTFSFSGNYNIEAGDELVVVYDGVTNPSSAGTWSTELDVNPQSSGGEATAEFSVDSDDATTTTETTTSTADTTTQNDDTTTESGGDDTTDGGEGSSNGGSPGFGVLVALAGVAGAALLARRY